MQTFCDTVWWYILKRCMLSKSLMWIPKVSSHWRKIFYQMHVFCLIKILLINNSRERIRFLACRRDSFARQNVVLSVMSSLIKLSLLFSVSIACSTVCSGADQRKHHSSEWLAFARGSHRRPVDSHYKEPVKRKMFPFDDVIMFQSIDVQRQLGLKLFGGNKQNQAELFFVCLFLNDRLISKII